MPLDYIRELFSPYGSGQQLYAEIRTLGPAGVNAPPPRFFPIGQAAEIVAYIRAQAQRFNVFVGVLPRSIERPYGSGGRDCDISVVAWLWVDIDAKGATESDVIAFLRVVKSRVPRPRMIVFSGSGGVHLYWRLRDPATLDTEKRKTFEATLRRLIILVGEGPDGLKADSACKNVSRILRIPDTMNFKHDPPRSVKWLLRDADDILTWEEWRARLPFEPQSPQVLRAAGRTSTARRDKAGITGLQQWAQAGYAEGERHRGLVGAAKYLRCNTNLNEAEARALFNTKASNSTGSHPITETELNAIWDWAAK